MREMTSCGGALGLRPQERKQTSICLLLPANKRPANAHMKTDARSGLAPGLESSSSVLSSVSAFRGAFPAKAPERSMRAKSLSSARTVIAGESDLDSASTATGSDHQGYVMRSSVGIPENEREERGPERAHEPLSLNEHVQAGERVSSRDAKISVVVSDASFMTSELLGRALSRVKTLSILQCAVSFGETLKAIVERAPDVAIVSTHLADGPYRGLEVVRQVRQLSARTRCVVLMDDSDHGVVTDAFRAGARGVFTRSASMALLARCIAAVHSGQIWASSADLQQVLGALEKAMPLRCVNSKGEALLTRREQEIVPLVAQGLTNKDISLRLNVSEHTIKNHLFRIYEKLGISSRVELILYAVSGREEGPQAA